MSVRDTPSTLSDQGPRLAHLQNTLEFATLALRSGSIVANEVYPRRNYC